MAATSKAAEKQARSKRLAFRLRIGLAVALVMMVLLGGRLFQVQALDIDGHAQEAVSERLRTVALLTERGDILDTEGRVMASSVERYDIVVDPGSPLTTPSSTRTPGSGCPSLSARPPKSSHGSWMRIRTKSRNA
ncbi:hypothetical protein [Nesterenkonia pannonica]|uniref:hypothetical protein n=1 Tax=Nesterenkonia pannonica TaxID=1548602 RepID=UPI002164EAB9|nr:hypothetical protein [Nesterenkonia pannonica]